MAPRRAWRCTAVTLLAMFAEVKGQDHVTEPLRQALRTGRVNHAYLFKRAARLRQDDQRAHPGPLAELRGRDRPRTGAGNVGVGALRSPPTGQAAST